MKVCEVLLWVGRVPVTTWPMRATAGAPAHAKGRSVSVVPTGQMLQTSVV
jgi:hypothetical protein